MVQEVLVYFGDGGKRGNRDFIKEGIKAGFKTPWDEVRGQVLIRSEEFVTEIVNRYIREREDKESEVSG
ncbi:MAG: hypothetical protein ACE5JU_01370 [Candidatus Binatia bacterium]